MLKYVASVLLLVCSSMLWAESFVAGKDYVIIKAPSEQVQTPHVNVTEFFSYGCSWCYRIEEALGHWVKQHNEAVTFQKIPVVFNKDWEYYAKAYYTAQALDLENQLTPALFQAILKDKIPLNTNQAMVNFLVQHGVDKPTATYAFNGSDHVNLELGHSKMSMAQYQINAIPAVVVGNQFKTDLQMAQNEARLLAILDFLVAKAGQDNMPVTPQLAQ